MYRVTTFDVKMIEENCKHVPEAAPLINQLYDMVDETFYDEFGVMVGNVVKLLTDLNLDDVYNAGYEAAGDDSAADWDSSYEDGHGDGYSDGYAEGLEAGYSQGYEEGHDDGMDLAETIHGVGETE